MKLVEDLKDRWNGLSPRIKRYILMGGIVVGFVGAIWAFNPGSGTHVSGGRKDVVQHVFSDKPTRSVSLDTMAVQLEDLKKRDDEKDREIKALKDHLAEKDKAAPGNPTSASIEMQLHSLEKRVGDLQQERANPPPEEPAASKAAVAPTNEDAMRAARAKNGTSFVPPMNFPSKPKVTDLYSPAAAPAGSAGGAKQANEAPTPAGPAKPIDFIGGDADAEAAEAAADAADAERYLPPGTILSGTLITGLDAPTGTNAKKEPFPALLRVKMDAILPNRYKSDVRECFLLMGGYGDLSSERAYMRGETISCMTKDRQVLESNLPAYAVGEDGKAGIRGRLVSKQGQVIGRALMAGFLEGVSKAFNVTPVPILQTNPTSSATQYQSNFAGMSSLQAAGLGGVGNAAERISQFYIDMASNIFPVIEVDAGRAIDLIAIRGVQLNFHKRGKLDGQGAGANGKPGGAPESVLDNMFGANSAANGLGNTLGRLAPAQGRANYSPLNMGSGSLP